MAVGVMTTIGKTVIMPHGHKVRTMKKTQVSEYLIGTCSSDCNKVEYSAATTR